MPNPTTPTPDAGRMPPMWIFTAPAPEPEVALILLNGTGWRLRHWTAGEWDQLQADERPAGTHAGDRGGRYLLDLTTTS